MFLGLTPIGCQALGRPGRLEGQPVKPGEGMIESQPIRHHIFRMPEPVRLCDGQPSGPDDIATREMEALREARAEATLCPTCQVNSGHQPFRLRPSRQGHGKRTLAYMYTIPVQDGFDDVRNCPHCRENPGKRTCRAWRGLARSVRVLQQEARLTAREVTELTGATGGRQATLYRFLDGSVGYLAPDAPPWQEAGEVTGRALARAFRVLGKRGVPAAAAPGNGATRAPKRCSKKAR